MFFNILLAPRFAVLLLVLASFGALGTAFYAEYAEGAKPCALCLWQRWPFVFVIALGAFFFLFQHKKILARLTMAGMVLSCFVGMGIAIHHVGVEEHWWEAASGCALAAAPKASDAAALREQLLATPITRCDQKNWAFLGFSMAAWNVVFSLALALYLLLAMIGEGCAHRRKDAQKNA
jgi:disulfide bond formation protein DsbB